MLLVVSKRQTANSKQQSAVRRSEGQKVRSQQVLQRIRQPDKSVCCLPFAVCCLLFLKLNPRSHIQFLRASVQVLCGEKVLNSKAQRFEHGNLLG